MIIHELHIFGFGRHSDFRVQIAPGLTVLTGDNESGKSTIMAFVRAMFYGFGRRHQALEKDRRRKYRPWNQQEMGGIIRFSHHGADYRLERRFGQERSGDESHLFREQTGEEMPLEDADRPGIVLLGLSEAEFINTLFAGQREIQVDAVSDLTSRLFDEAGSVYGAADCKRHLRDAKLALTGRRGRLADIEARFEQVSAAYTEAKAAAGEKAELSRSLNTIEQRIQAIEAQLNETRQHAELEADLDLIERGEAVRALDTEAVSADQSPHRIMITKEGEDITIRALSDLSDRYQAMLQTEAKLEQLAIQWQEQDELLRGLARDYDMLTEEFAAAEAEADASRKKRLTRLKAPSKMAMYACFVLLGAGTLLFFLALILGQSAAAFTYLLLAAVAALLSGAIGLFLDTKRRHQLALQQRSAFFALKRERAEAEERLKQVMNMQQQVAGYYQQTKRAHDALQHQVSETDTDLKRSAAGLLYDLEPYCGEVEREDIGYAISRLRQQMMSPADMARAQQYRKLMQDQTDDEFWQAVGDAESRLVAHGIDPADYKQAKLRLERAASRLPDIAGAAQLREELKTLALKRQELFAAFAWIGRDLEPLEEIVRTLFALEEERRLGQLLVSALDRAEGWLNGAIADVDTRLAPRLNELASDFLAAMTGEKYKSVFIDRSFAVHVESEDGQLREEASFSGATVDQIELALRLALSTVISDDAEQMPLFLDETLVQLDAVRLKQTLRLLAAEATGKRRQIVYLTSDSRIAGAIDAAAAVVVIT